MKRAAALAIVLCACGSETPSPRSEVSIAPAPAPSALPSAAPSSSSSSSGDVGQDAGLAPQPADTTTAPKADLSRDAIHDVVASHRSAITRCYEKALLANPHLEGRVFVRFVIDPSGQVSSAESAPPTTMSDAKVVSCVLHEFRGMHFAAHDAPAVSVVYPFIFTPADH